MTEQNMLDAINKLRGICKETRHNIGNAKSDTTATKQSVNEELQKVMNAVPNDSSSPIDKQYTMDDLDNFISSLMHK